MSHNPPYNNRALNRWTLHKHSSSDAKSNSSDQHNLTSRAALTRSINGTLVDTRGRCRPSPWWKKTWFKPTEPDADAVTVTPRTAWEGLWPGMDISRVDPVREPDCVGDIHRA